MQLLLLTQIVQLDKCNGTKIHAANSLLKRNLKESVYGVNITLYELFL